MGWLRSLGLARKRLLDLPLSIVGEVARRGAVWAMRGSGKKKMVQEGDGRMRVLMACLETQKQGVGRLGG